MEFKVPVTNWMWLPEWNAEDASHPCLVYFRRRLTVTKEDLQPGRNSFLVALSADTRYKLYVNGRLAAFGPSRGNREVWFYDELNLAPYLTEGDNILATEVLRYPEDPRRGNHGMMRTYLPGFYIRAAGMPVLESGWRCRKAEGYSIVPESSSFAPLQFMEDRRGESAAGFRYPDYDDADWPEARRYPAYEISSAVSPGNLQKRTIPYLKLVPSKLTGVVCLRDEKDNITEDTAGTIAAFEALLRGEGTVRIPAGESRKIDLTAGEEMVGYLSVRLAEGRGSRIQILCSEAYSVKGSDIPSADNPTGIPRKEDRCDYVNGVLKGYTDVFHPDGYGTTDCPEIYEPFWFRTFRFVQILAQAGEEDLQLCGLDYLETGYPLEVKTTVQTSDVTLGPVWDISLRTLKRCMLETYVDCPFYEQLQYAMDSRSEILYTYAVSADDRLARKCMDDFRKSQRSDGMINCSYPNIGPNVIPGFAIYYICMLRDHMMYFGDREFLRQHMGCVDGILEYFRRNIEDRGLVGRIGGPQSQLPYWSFIDWTPQWDRTRGMPAAGLTGPITMESLLYILGLTEAADVLDYLGRGETASEYRTRADAIRLAVNTFCRDEAGFYTDGPGVAQYSQHCQVFAVLTDTCPVSEGAGLLRTALADPVRFAPCSVAMSFYLFRALEKADLYEETDHLWDLWRDMVDKHLTTCVEDGVRGRSDCHAWGALALYELPSAALGVRPAAPGYSVVSIRPVPGKLKWAKGRVATRWGMVDVAWKRQEDGSLSLTYKVPEGIRAEISPA